MAYTIAILFFIVLSILLAALMAGKTGGKDVENTKPPERNQSDGDTTRELGGVTLSNRDHTLTTARSRQSGSVSPSGGGSHGRVHERVLDALPNSNTTTYAAGGSAVGLGNIIPLESSGGSGGSFLNRVTGDQGSSVIASGGSPQGRKRGRDFDLNKVPGPVHRGSPKAGAIPPPPPPPPKQQVAHGVGAVGLPFPCSLCSRGFETPKGLCGHMRAHPERTWRGAHPPPVFSREEFRSVAAASINVLESSSGGNVAAPDVNTITDDQNKDASASVAVGGLGGAPRGGGSSTEVVPDQERHGKILPFDLNASPPKEEKENHEG